MRYLLIFSGILALTITSVATGVTGDTIKEGQRNPAGGNATQETWLVADHGSFTGRFTNFSDAGGSLVAACRAVDGNDEPCLRSRNFNGGSAFQFIGLDGNDPVGEILGAPGAAPFTTTANGVATGLNADQLDGFDAEDLMDESGPSTVGEHWGPIARNTIGSPVEELRNGPYVSPPGAGDSPPFGVGSLGFEVAVDADDGLAGMEKASFGNEVDFLGDLVTDLEETGFHVHNTGENVTNGGANNLPNITFEVDPTGFGSGTAPNFSSMVFIPSGPVPTNRWSDYIDATDGADGEWYFTNATTATATGCTQASPCSFADLQTGVAANYPGMQITSAAVAKGRDNTWQGAVDGFRINDDIFDFEIYGVRTEEAPAEET